MKLLDHFQKALGVYLWLLMIENSYLYSSINHFRSASANWLFHTLLQNKKCQSKANLDIHFYEVLFHSTEWKMERFLKQNSISVSIYLFIYLFNY